MLNAYGHEAMNHRRVPEWRLPLLIAVASLVVTSCSSSKEIAAISYVCGSGPPPATDAAKCGVGDPKLPPEPTLPTEVCQTLLATKSGPDEDNLDTERIQLALRGCTGRVVKLMTDGGNNAFVAGHLDVASVTLWVDAGVTLFASRQPELYQKTGNCGKLGVNDSSACTDFLTVSGTSPAIVGDGAIDGQGDQPLVGRDYSWWQSSNALREINGSIGNPTLINLASKTTGFLLYRISLYNSPKFHVKLTSVPASGTCSRPGEGFTVWGVTILTPSRWKNSEGLVMTPHAARNTDGIDPGTTDNATCGVIACSTISTSDDQIAIKGGHRVADLVIAHNHFGTGHGMSIGSETYGGLVTDGVKGPSVENIDVYDLTIDGDSRAVGLDSSPADSNGIRIKSDASRGGVVNNIRYRDVCMRDMANAILISTAYNPLFAGTAYPQFTNITFENVRHVTCMGTLQPVVTIEGFNAGLPAGPITLDNVVIDNISDQAVAAEYADIRMGPSGANFTPRGPQVTVTGNAAAPPVPFPCNFPVLPTPEKPAGWLW